MPLLRGFSRLHLPPLIFVLLFASAGAYYLINSFATTICSPLVSTCLNPGSTGIKVSVNRLVDQNNNPVVLHGVDAAGSSYACDATSGGYGFTDANIGDTEYDPMRSNAGGTIPTPWNINSVWFGLSQDCWLNIYGAGGQGGQYSGVNYINYVKSEVSSMEEHDIYPVLGFGLGSPYGQRNEWAGDAGEEPMPNNAHEPLLWEEIANTFKNDPNVIFKIYQEPYPDNQGVSQAAWSCWANGDVQYLSNSVSGHLPSDPSDYSAYTAPTAASSVTHCNENSTASGTHYDTVGMQSLINIIRGTGATNVIQVPGVAWANALSCTNDGSETPSQCGFLAPNLDGVLAASGGAVIHDTLSPQQLMATTDDYPGFGQFCGATQTGDISCFNSEYKPVANVMPIAMGEVGPGTSDSNAEAAAQNLVDAYDGIGQSYYGSQWTPGDGLITSYNGAVATPWGAWFESHIASSTAPTDLNSDGTTNIFDLSIFLDHMGQTGTNLPGDFNNDGKVDSADLSILQGQWGR